MPTPISLRAVHHVELLVGNAKQAEFFYRNAFGFDRLAYAGPETGERRHASYVMKQGSIRLVLTTPLLSDDPRNRLLKDHGDGVVDVAFEVADVDAAFHMATERGALPAVLPEAVADAQGSVRRAAVRTYGDTVHSFIAKKEYSGPFLPGYVSNLRYGYNAGLKAIDHIVGNVEDGKMEQWAAFYERVFGFERFLSFDDKDISTEYSALRSIVMSSPEGVLKMPINEPAGGKGGRKSQIQEYIDYNLTPGVQHLALRTNDILETVTKLKAAGVEFLYVPQTYYAEVWDRVGVIAEDREAVKSLGVLVDRDEEGYLLQLFSKPLQDRPTLFFEIIQRRGCQSFGKGNFKALFESIEREQALRGNL